nr:MAG TPA_asm: Follistatin/hypothetical protein [Caudoviricetes sp.]
MGVAPAWKCGNRVCPSKPKACVYMWAICRFCGAGKVCYARPRGGGW